MYIQALDIAIFRIGMQRIADVYVYIGKATLFALANQTRNSRRAKENGNEDVKNIKCERSADM